MSIWVAATFNLIGTMATLVCLGITASSCKKTASIMQEILTDRRPANSRASHSTSRRRLPAVPDEPMDESELLAELASDKITMPMMVITMGGRFFDCKDAELTVTMKVNDETMEGCYVLIGDTVQEGRME